MGLIELGQVEEDRRPVGLLAAVGGGGRGRPRPVLGAEEGHVMRAAGHRWREERAKTGECHGGGGSFSFLSASDSAYTSHARRRPEIRDRYRASDTLLKTMLGGLNCYFAARRSWER